MSFACPAVAACSGTSTSCFHVHVHFLLALLAFLGCGFPSHSLPDVTTSTRCTDTEIILCMLARALLLAFPHGAYSQMEMIEP